MTSQQLADLLEEGARLFLLDVRTPAEFRAEHIPGAKLIPLQELPGRMGEVPKDRDVVVVCRSGSRSAVAASILTKAGFPRVYNLTGGMLAWQRLATRPKPFAGRLDEEPS